MELEEREAKVCRLCGQFERLYIDVFGEEGTRRYLSVKIHSKINIMVSCYVAWSRGLPIVGP